MKIIEDLKPISDLLPRFYDEKGKMESGKDIKIPVIVSKLKAELILEIEPVVEINGKKARVITTPDSRIVLAKGDLSVFLNLQEDILRLIERRRRK